MIGRVVLFSLSATRTTMLVSNVPITDSQGLKLPEPSRPEVVSTSLPT